MVDAKIEKKRQTVFLIKLVDKESLDLSVTESILEYVAEQLSKMASRSTNFFLRTAS